MNTLLKFAKEHLLSDFAAEVNLIRGQHGALSVESAEETDGKVVFNFAPASGIQSMKITADIGEENILLSLDAEIQPRNGAACGFAPERAIVMTLGDLEPDALLGSRHDGPWWMYPTFGKDFSALASRTQSLLVKSGALNYHLLPLTGDNFRCEFNAGKVEFTSDMSGICHLTGAFMAISASTDPLAAVEMNYRGARKLGGIRVPLRSERQLPEFFKGFGWCTWDAFYKEVTSEKIYEKLSEFRNKGIPVKWVIIDDGWMTVNGDKLAGFDVDRTKFPEGLKATIARMKSEFGVEKVGVWHAFNGYWRGIDMTSALYFAQRENLFVTPGGLALPSLDEEKAFRFWDAWHSFLASEGVDFLKVDNQSSNSTHIIGAVATAEGCRRAHNSIERSISKNFGGAVIDCMGMDMENVLARPMSAVSRNSDDFFPKRERGFIKHLIQNAYNAIWHSQIHYCDFDMWWSDHFESAYQSGVLRAISGSPIYVSDKIGESNRETILPTIDEDGSVMLCDEACRPTLDCVYTDCAAEKKLLKVWNRSGENFAVAAFNVNDEEVSDTLDFTTIPGLSQDREYVAYEYFTKKFLRICFFEDTALTLPKDGVAVWSIYPVEHPVEDSDEGAYIMLGDTSKYVPIASKHRKKTALTDIL